MVDHQMAFCVSGNHDAKLQKKLSGKKVNLKHGLAQTVEQLASYPAEWIEQVREFIYALPTHYLFDGGNLANSMINHHKSDSGSKFELNY